MFFKLTSVLLAGVLSVLVTVLSTGITLGFNVSYSGKQIAVIHDSAVFENAKSIAAAAVSGDSAVSEISAPKYSLTLTVSAKLDSAARVAEAIIKNTDGFTYASALLVNGSTVACVSEDCLEELIEERRTAFYVANAENSADFVDNVRIENGYYLKGDIISLYEAESIIDSLEVKTVSYFNTDTVIPYTTETVKTDTQPLGYNEVTTAGENGISRKSLELVTVNGEELSRQQLSEITVKEPVKKIITVGTAPVRVTATERARATSAGFICPINAGQYTISAYYGDGRNHRGLDFAANKGTAIFAAAGGTVTYTGFDSDYGYNVVIDHGNGIKTRYAHASAMCVNTGDTVAQGDMIAVVGNTGRSTGNHLHFEVIINGTRVNPAPYVGM